MKPRGFTLVEVLVVLVITSMVSALLFQVLAQVGRVQSRFGEQLAESQGGAMRAEWFRQVVQGLQPVEADDPQRFDGQPRRWVGLTRTGLQALPGAPQFVALEIVPAVDGLGGVLRYAPVSPDGSPGTTLLSWTGRGAAEFVYLDSSGVEYSQWPPAPGQYRFDPGVKDLGRSFTAEDARATPPQLPSAILLRWPGARGRAVMVAAPRASLEALPKRLEAGGLPVPPR